MPTITTPFTGDEMHTTRMTRLSAIHDFWWGSGAFVAAANLGGVRTQMNTISPNDGTNLEAFTSWLTKWNALNEPDKLLHDTLKDANPGLLVLADDVARVFGANGGAAVTTAGDAVSLIADDYAGITLGSELATNGDFSSATGWTAPTGWTIAGGKATKTAGTANSLTRAFTLATGKAYLVETVYDAITASTVTPRFTGGATVTGLARSAAGTYRQVMVATANHTTLDIQATATTAAVLDSISVKEITNWPAFQNTAAARMRWGRAPRDVRNVLPNSDFGGASASPETAPTSWTFAPVSGRGTLSAVAATGEQGGNQITLTASAEPIRLTGPTLGIKAGETVTASVRCQLESGTNEVRNIVAFSHDPDGDLTITYRLNGAVVAGTTAIPAGANLIEAVCALPVWLLDGGSLNPNGAWYDSGASSGVTTTISVGATRTNAVTATCDITLWAPQVEFASTRSSYQRRGATPTDITQTGVTSYGLLSADGSDDALNVQMAGGGTVSLGFFGRGGSYLVPTITLAAPSRLTVGPLAVFDDATEIAAIPHGILRAIGATDWSSQFEIVGMAVLKANPSAEEQLRALRYFAAYGARGYLSEGSDLIVNGAFGADTDWSKGTGWTIGSGVATKTAGTASLLSQEIGVVPRGIYLLQYTMTRSAGSLTPRFFGGTTFNGAARSAAGTYVQVLVAQVGTSYLQFSADSAFAGTVDAVSLKRLTPGF